MNKSANTYFNITQWVWVYYILLFLVIVMQYSIVSEVINVNSCHYPVVVYTVIN